MTNVSDSNCVLAVDIGTTALKAAVINASGEVLDYSRIDFFKNVEQQKGIDARANRFSEQWFLALKEACAKMSGAAQNAKAICISGNGPTIVFADGTTLLWNTNECFSNYKQDFQQPKCIEAAGDIEQPQLAETARRSIFLPRILAAKNLYSTLFQSEQKIFSGPEFLVNKLCGAEATILPEPRFESAYWNDEILEALQIPREKLCPFAPPTKPLGKLKSALAKELHLPEHILVICSGPDFIAALVGTNTLSAGALCDRAGSSEGINLCTPRPVEAKGIRTLPSVAETLWNASYLIQDPGNSIEEKAANFAKGIAALKTATTKTPSSKSAYSTNSDFCSLPLFTAPVIITGGQARNPDIVQAKADAAGIKIGVQQIADAELLGDAAFAFTALGEFDSIQKAADTICKTTKIFYPKNARE